MRFKKFALGLAIALLSVGARAETDIAATNPKAAAAISAVKELCLAGTQFDLKADVNGTLTLLKLAPGAQGSVSVNVRNSAGAAAIFDDKVRQVADEDIRTCIKPYITRIIDAILGDGSSSKSTSITWTDRPSSNTVPVGPFGCGCAAVSRSDSSIKVTNGCSLDLPVTAVRGTWVPSATPPPGPNYPWALVPTPGRQYANLTLAAGRSVTFDGAKQVFLWICPPS